MKDRSMNGMKVFWSRLRQSLIAFAIPLLLIFVLSGLAYRFVDPAPPKRLVISTGEDGGNYQEFAKEYKEFLKAEGGVDLEIRPSKGAWENLKLLDDSHSGIDVAFVQDGLGTRQKNPGLRSLGSVFYEPIWVFYRGKTELTRFSQFQRKKIAMGEKGGETHSMAKKLLGASGVDDKNAEFVEISTADSVAALQEGRVDAAFFIAPATNTAIVEMIKNPDLHLMSTDQAEAITKQFHYLHHLVLPHGTVDLQKNLPSKDIDLIAPTATLVVREKIHPALVYLLLKGASKVHRGPGIFEQRHEFPTDKDFVFPLSPGAKNFYQSGAPFWLRYLPFWLAVLAERFIFLVIPMAALIIPIFKAIPRFLQWRIKNRIYQRYGELKFLEGQIKPESAHERCEHFLEQLDRIEERVSHMKVPLDFSEYVYSLKGHIQLVRDRLNRLLQSPELKLKMTGGREGVSPS